MRFRRVLAAALVAAGVLSAVLGIVPGGVAPVRAADYRMVTAATYTVRPADRLVGVRVHVTFRNTTPDPPGHFSVFEVIDLAVHDGAKAVRATDRRGRLKTSVSHRGGITVVSVRPRSGVRYRKNAEFTLRYTLPDAASRDVRIRSSVVTFPVWSFGTHGDVEVHIPSDYQVLVDGDRLTAEQDGGEWILTSGEVKNPSRWLSLLTATQPSTFVTASSPVALAAGALEVQVRSWSDDRAWGRRILDLASRALPRLERAIGFDLPTSGPLVLVESLPAAGGEISEPVPEGTDVAIGFDEPAFTVIHQLAHGWYTPELAADQWIREGFASYAASRVAGRVHAKAPYEPRAATRAMASDAFPLVSWGAGEASVGQERYAYAASWVAAGELTEAAGAQALELAWRRFAAGLDGYQPLDVAPVPGQLASVPADSRHLLDQLEAVSGKDLSGIFERWVFDKQTSALLPERATAREEAEALAAEAGEWGIPDPVRLALAGWRFDDARVAIGEATAWLHDRDVLVDDIHAAGLAVPDRLRDQYRTGGGSNAAREELDAERDVVTSYASARDLMAKPRGPLERIGLLGSDDPAAQLDEAQVAFAEGDLVGAGDLSSVALNGLQDAGRDGLVRLVSGVVVLVLLIAGTIWLVRRRRQSRIDGYTGAP